MRYRIAFDDGSEEVYTDFEDAFRSWMNDGGALEIIEDGLTTSSANVCCNCGHEVQFVRPGKWQCNNCDARERSIE